MRQEGDCAEGALVLPFLGAAAPGALVPPSRRVVATGREGGGGWRGEVVVAAGASVEGRDGLLFSGRLSGARQASGR